MSAPAAKAEQPKAPAPADRSAALQSSARATTAFDNNRPAAASHRQQQSQISASPRMQRAAASQALITQSPRQQAAQLQAAVAPVQRQETPAPVRENKTGLPDKLKAGVENLSGYSLDDVQVHYNSDKPAQLQAHAYAQGTDIHVAPGQEQHLPHEAWHVVQQKQGRVKPTRQLKGQVPVNDDAGLEKEADAMSVRALQLAANQSESPVDQGFAGVEKSSSTQSSIINRLSAGNENQAERSVQLRTYSTAAIIQRYPTAMDDENARAFATQYSVAFNDREEQDPFTEAEFQEIKQGVYMLTDLFPGMQANCIGWAQDTDSIKSTGSIYTWEQNYTPTAANAANAKIILWGTKNEEDEDDENKWKILHASVLLTHAEIEARSRQFSGFDLITRQALQNQGIADPSWTSVGGFGLGCIVHPRNWLEGGSFGTALKGMR